MDSSRIPLRRLKKGDRPKASEWNAIVDSLSRIDLNSERAAGPKALPFDPDVVTVLNSTGAALQPFSVVGLDPASAAPISHTANLGQFQLHRPFTAVATVVATHSHGRFGVMLEAVATGSYGRAAVAGVVPVQIAINDADHTHADIAAASTSLTSCSYGPAKILWLASSGATRWAIVRLGSTTHALFPVKVEQTGGSAGNATTQCSFTYTVTDLAGYSLGSGLSPLKTRPALGAIDAPAADSYGLGFYDTAGVFKLWDANETLDASAC